MRLGAILFPVILAGSCMDAGMRLPGSGAQASPRIVGAADTATPAPASAPVPVEPSRPLLIEPAVAVTSMPQQQQPAPPEPPAPPPPTTVEYTSPGGITETCQLLVPFPFTPPDVQVDPTTMRWYRDADREDIAKLCRMDFYATVTTDAVTAVGVCPKIHWSTPAFELYDLDGTGLGKTDFEKQRCPRYRYKRNASKLAKAKTAVYTKENESGLIYFHFSRLLGNAALIYPATYRSIARKEVVKVAQKGIAIIEATTIARSPLDGWKVLRSRHRNRAGAADVVASSLAKNPRHEVSHNPFKYFSDQTRIGSAGAFQQTSYYRLVNNRKPLAEQVDLDVDNPKKYRQAVQKLAYAEDFTSLVILDHLFLQRDRPGNIHGRVFFHFIDDQGHLRWKKDVDPGDPEATMVPLLRLILKDNDDGVKWGVTPRMNLTRLLDDIHHLDPLVYARIQWLAGLLADPTSAATIRSYFLDTVHISPGVYDVVRERFLALALEFEKAYDKGDLELDLDLQLPVASAPPLPVAEPKRTR